MTDFGHEARFGAFINPSAAEHERVVSLAVLADSLGLDAVAIQDHPYQPALLDTWTLLPYLAARTSRVTLMPDVTNLALRPPAVLARAAASVDILSGGRFEMGLGSGGFWDAAAAMGAPHRGPGEAVEALEEAIAILRALWIPGRGATYRGKYYQLSGAKTGPAHPHRIGIWVGAHKPRMLELTGRLGDGWLPTSGAAGPEEIGELTKRIDDAAADAGRDPADIVRAYNIAGRFSHRAKEGFLHGPPEHWAEQLTELALVQGLSMFHLMLGADAERDLRLFAEEVAPRVRAALAHERRGAPGPEQAAPPQEVAAPASSVVRPDGTLDDATRPRLPKRDIAELAPAQRRHGEHLVRVHDELRKQLGQIRDAVEQVTAGTAGPAAARSAIDQMTLRQNYWTLGSFCASYCSLLTFHHTNEDEALFPGLPAADPSFAPVTERLAAEHEAIAEVLVGLDAALVAMVEEPRKLAEVRQQVGLLEDVLLSHLDYEEDELVEPIARLNIGA